MMLIQSLEYLVDTLERRGKSVRPYLRPGLLQSAIEVEFASLGLVPPHDLLALYQWHDGIDVAQTRDTALLFGDHTFSSLIDAVNNYHNLNQYYSSSDIDLSRCFPFAEHDSDTLAVYCSDTPFGGLHYPIVHVFYDISIGFENLETLVQTATAWFVHGVYDSSPVNEELHKSIWQSLNPNVIPRDMTL